MEKKNNENSAFGSFVSPQNGGLFDFLSGQLVFLWNVCVCVFNVFSLNGRLGEGNSQVARVTELIVVHFLK